MRYQNVSYKMVYVNPKNVRFTQTSIAGNFREPYRHVSLEAAKIQIEKGELKSSDFRPYMEVYKDEQGIMWSKDNRRLWVFRKAGLDSVRVRLLKEPFDRIPPAGPQREQMAAEDYFPVVRGSLFHFC